MHTNYTKFNLILIVGKNCRNTDVFQFFRYNKFEIINSTDCRFTFICILYETWLRSYIKGQLIPFNYQKVKTTTLILWSAPFNFKQVPVPEKIIERSNWEHGKGQYCSYRIEMTFWTHCVRPH